MSTESGTAQVGLQAQRRLPGLLLAAIALLAMALLVTMLLGGRGAQWLFGALAMLLPVALMALGALRNGRLGRVAPALLALALLLEGGYLGMAALAGQVLEAPWIAGLPAAAALFFAACWLLPLLLVSLTYALTFRTHGISEADLATLRNQPSAK